MVDGHGEHCLGPSKGRNYPTISKKAKQYLEDYYSKENAELASLLHKLNRSHPIWLQRALSHAPQ